MKTFSIVGAATEPFSLAFRRPVATLVWGLVSLSPVILALVLMGFALSPNGMLEFLHEPNPEADLGALLKFQIWSELINLLQFFISLVVAVAVMRAVIFGRSADPWAFLRLGMDEFRVVVVALVIIIGLVVAIIPVALLLGTTGYVLHEALGRWAAAVYVTTGLVVAVAVLLLSGRLALLGPACLHYKTLAFAEGWRLGRGRTLALTAVILGVVLGWVVLCLAIVAAVVAVVALLSVTGVLSGFEAGLENFYFERWVEDVAARPLWPSLVMLALVPPLAWLQGLGQALFVAPFARVVRELTTPRHPISADTEASSQ